MGENVRQMMSGPLSQDSAFSLLVTGDFTSREINNLIKQLKLQLEFVLEDEKPEHEMG